MKFFILIGPPGSGKGTLSNLLVSEHDWIQLSTGNLCRKHIAQGTSLGQQIDFAIKSGKLVPDEVITDMVAQWIEQQPEGSCILLDGYPRTVAQAHAFTQMLSTRFGDAQAEVIRLTIADDKVIERLHGRVVCRNKECQAVFSLIAGSPVAPKQEMVCDKCSAELERRADDELETIKSRLRTYYQHETPLVDFYQGAGQSVHKLDVGKKLEDIFVDFKKLVSVEQK